MDWHPDIADRPGPRYLAIADQLERDIRRGRLNAGHRLPTHRALARSLGVTVGTVTRAYGLAERQGLISGTVGRGTFVNPLKVHASDLDVDAGIRTIGLGAGRPEPIDLATAQPASTQRPVSTQRRAGRARKGKRPAIDPAAADRPDVARWAADLDPVDAAAQCERACGAWLRRSGHLRPGAAVVPIARARQALVVSLATLTRGPGAAIACDRLTSADLGPIARVLGLQTVAVAGDDDGMTAEALELAFRSVGLAAVYLTPSCHGPTIAATSVSRRSAIAQVAARYDCPIIEDRRSAALDTELNAAATAMAALAPEATLTIHDLSGRGHGGLDMAAVTAPQRMSARLRARRAVFDAIPTATAAATFAMSVDAGVFEDHRAVWRSEIAARVAMAREILADFDLASRADAEHVWLPLPAPWRLADFVRQLADAGVTVAAADNFVADQGPVPPAVQIGLGGPAERTVLREALLVVARVLSRGPEPDLGIG